MVVNLLLKEYFCHIKDKIFSVLIVKLKNQMFHPPGIQQRFHDGEFRPPGRPVCEEEGHRGCSQNTRKNWS